MNTEAKPDTATGTGWTVLEGQDDFVRPFDVAISHTSAWNADASAQRLCEWRLVLARHADTTWLSQPGLVILYPNETAFVTEKSPATIPSDDMSDPAATLAAMYQYSGLTYDQIAGALRVSRQSVNNWRRGEPVSDTNRRRIAFLNRAMRDATGRVAASPTARHQYLLAEDPHNPGRSRLATLAFAADEVVPVTSGRLTPYDLLTRTDAPEPVRPAGRSHTFGRVRRSGRSPQGD